MNNVLGDYIDKFALVYLGDILVYSRSAEEHEAHLCQVFTWLHKHKLKVKRIKCEFSRSCVKYLGHVAGSDELRVDPDKILTVADWAAPRDIKGV